MRTDIKLTSIDTQAKKNTLSITHANPNASNYAMRTLAQKINALTTNTYSGASRVDTTDLANAVAKQTPTFSANISATGISINYDGDADYFIIGIPKAKSEQVIVTAMPSTTEGRYPFLVQGITPGQNQTITAQAPETTNYYASEVVSKTI